uniref:Uncharacterized protein n=1 Tax=Amorphochlora amoebiformis TaxID=1561963 RepID=A0A7S0DG78_9EUKA|mmetsp:Transcript_26833/g.42598  ORF Transcript_26833/g.42598 Transcript_26833/m.42598 type:complete len:131 (+) Transcript_26833:86-478(+)
MNLKTIRTGSKAMNCVLLRNVDLAIMQVGVVPATSDRIVLIGESLRRFDVKHIIPEKIKTVGFLVKEPVGGGRMYEGSGKPGWVTTVENRFVQRSVAHGLQEIDLEIIDMHSLVVRKRNQKKEFEVQLLT